MTEQMYKTMMKKYEAQIEDAILKIDTICESTIIIPEHIDITGEIDKLLQTISEAEDKVASLWKHYGKKEANKAVL